MSNLSRSCSGMHAVLHSQGLAIIINAPHARVVAYCFKVISVVAIGHGQGISTALILTSSLD